MLVREMKLLVNECIPSRGRALALLKALGHAHAVRRWLDLPEEDRKQLSNMVSEWKGYGWPIESNSRHNVGKVLTAEYTTGRGLQTGLPETADDYRRMVYRFDPAKFRKLREWAKKNRSKLDAVQVAVLKAMRVLVR